MLKNFSSSTKGTLILLIASLVWGSTFVPQKIAMDYWSPFQFTSFRFIIGATFLSLLIPRFKNSVDNKREFLLFGVLLGFFLGFAAFFQQLGIVSTSATNAGFFTSLYVPMVPIIGLFIGLFPHWSLWIGIVLCLIGSIFMGIPVGEFKLDNINVGDLWVILGAFFWACHVQLLAESVKRFPIIILAVCQFFSAGIILGMVGIFYEGGSFIVLPSLNDHLSLVTLLYCSVGSVCIAFVLQMIGQRFSPPSQAAIVMSMEAVFAAFFGWLILAEFLNLRSFFGASFILFGILVSQLAPNYLKKIQN